MSGLSNMRDDIEGVVVMGSYQDFTSFTFVDILPLSPQVEMKFQPLYHSKIFGNNDFN